MALGYNDGTVSVWNILTGKEATPTILNAGRPLSFSADGKYLVSGMDNFAYVWEVSTGKEIAHMFHNASVFSAAFSPDGRYVASGGYGFTIHVWDASTGIETVHVYEVGEIRSVAFSPDGRYVASAGPSSVVVLEAATGREIKRIDSGATKVFFSPDGKLLIAGANIGEYARPSVGVSHVWDVTTWREISSVSHEINMIPLALSPDGKYLLFGGNGSTVGWKWRPEDLIADACANVTRNLTRAEWERYIGDAIPYQAVCPDLPSVVEPTPFPFTTPTLTFTLTPMPAP